MLEIIIALLLDYLNANDTIGIHPYDSGDATNAAIEANIHHTYFKGYLIG